VAGIDAASLFARLLRATEDGRPYASFTYALLSKPCNNRFPFDKTISLRLRSGQAGRTDYFLNQSRFK
jgi:hypothetical protein